MKVINRSIIAFLVLLLSLVVSQSLHAQKYACVNTEYILSYLPEYAQVLNKLDKFMNEWQEELESKQEELEALRQQYQQESYLLPDNLKQRRKEEIQTKETELRASQQQHFGVGGDLDRKREELLKPVMDRLYGAIERVAHEKSYAFVFDKASSTTILYVAEKYDISDQVLEMLGVKKGSMPVVGKQPTDNGQGKDNSSDKKDNQQNGRNTNLKKNREIPGKDLPTNGEFPGNNGNLREFGRK